MTENEKYQNLLENVLEKGLEDLLEDLQSKKFSVENLPPEINGLPKSSFELLVWSFRNSLPKNVLRDFPEHDFQNQQYLELILGQIRATIGETEARQRVDKETIASLPPNLKQLVADHERIQIKQTEINGLISQQQSLFQQSINTYHQKLFNSLQEQFQKELSSLPEEKRNQMAQSVVLAVQNKVLQNKDINPDSWYEPKEIQEMVKDVVRTTIREETANFENNEGVELTAKPQAVEEMAQTIASRETPVILETKKAQKPILTRFEEITAKESVFQIEENLRLTIVENLPAEIGANPQKVEAIIRAVTPEVMFRIGGAGGGMETPQQYLEKTIGGILNSQKIQKTLTQQGISASQQKEFTAKSTVIAEKLAPQAQQFVSSGQFSQTSLAGSMGGGGAGGGFGGGGGSPTGGGTPTGGMPGPGTGTVSNQIISPEGSLQDIFYSSGQPLHLFTALASPHSGENLFNWLLTGGPIKSAIGFIYDSTPGIPHLDYFNVGLGLMFQTKKQLEQTLMTLQPPERLVPPPPGQGYERRRELQEIKDRLSFVNQQIDILRKIPGFDNFYNFYYSGWGQLLHPLQSFQLWTINKNIFAGLGVSGVVNTLSWTVQYGPAGFAYGVQQLPVQFGLLALKWGMAKTGLYKVVGLPGSRHYVFAPTYELGLWTKKLVYKKVLQPLKIGLGRGLISLGKKLKIPGLVSFGKKIITGFVGKALAALMKFLGILGILWNLLKIVWNKFFKPALLFLLYLILTHGLWAGGGALGGMLLALPLAIKAFAATFAFCSTFMSPFLAWIPATVVFLGVETVAALVGAGAGILIENIWNWASEGFSSFAGNLMTSLSSAVSGIPAFLGQTLAITGLSIGIPTIFLNMFILPGAFNLAEKQARLSNIFYSDCKVTDIHKTDTITQDAKDKFVAKYSAMFPNSLLKEKIDEVIVSAQAAGLNPALAVAIWAEESHFSNYSEKNVSQGNDFGCGVGCGENRPKDFGESLACLTGKKAVCNNTCFSKPDFSSFMECYGPATINPNFISNALSFYRQLIPEGTDAISCPGGTTKEFASTLLNTLLSCYQGNIINKLTFTDKGSCLLSKGISQKTVDEIIKSIDTAGLNSLQCVGFVKAVEAATGGTIQNTAYSSAKNFYLSGTPGYQNISAGSKNVRVGDIAVWDGTDGHMGIVVEVNSDMTSFKVDQAIGTDKNNNSFGLINESKNLSVFDPNLLGFLRRINK